jgi:hypothetical protein
LNSAWTANKNSVLFVLSGIIITIHLFFPFFHWLVLMHEMRSTIIKFFSITIFEFEGRIGRTGGPSKARWRFWCPSSSSCWYLKAKQESFARDYQTAPSKRMVFKHDFVYWSCPLHIITYWIYCKKDYLRFSIILQWWEIV